MIDPISKFREIYDIACNAERHDPGAVALATVDSEGNPDVRMVLYKGLRAIDNSFTFFTNKESVKGRQLTTRPVAALCFYWKSIRRQIRVAGPIQILTDEENDAYFNSRPRGSQIGAHISKQSAALNQESDLTALYDHFEQQIKDEPIERPYYWGGFSVVPMKIEFWANRQNRLHFREEFSRDNRDSDWKYQLLNP